MRFSIIINTHNQAPYIYECINSCLKQEYQNFEVIITDTSDVKINKKYTKSKKIKYFYFKSKSRYPVMDQMHQVLYGLNKSSGDYICLLDGDDKISNKKLKKLSEILKNKKIFINQDMPTFFSKNKVLNELTKKNYKNNIFYKKIFIEWPQIFGTSAITVRKDILKKFFKKTKPFKWKYLAIDVQLILFCNFFLKVENKLDKITFKRKHSNNLDDTFSNIFSRAFWIRRKMQFDLCKQIKKKNNLNLDNIITNFINFFLKIL